MKTVIRFSIALALVFALIVGVSVSRAALMSYNSGFQVQNLEGTDANITIQFYDRSGTAVTTVTDTVPANTNNTYFPLTNLGNEGASVPAGFDGSVVIASDKKVASITNILGSDGSDPLAFGASYKGFTGGSNSASLPLLMKGNYGFNTWFSVQNVGSTSSNVTVTYSDGVVAGPIAVAPGAAAKFEQANEAHASGWVGSAVVDSPSAPVAITALEVGPTTLFAYDGFSGGSTNPVMPLVNENNYGYITGIQVQNLGASSTNVTVSYKPSAGQPGTACTETRTIAAGKSVNFALYVFTSFADPASSTLLSENCVQGERFIGSASVTANTASQALVAIVNQLNQADNKGAAYGAFDPAAGTDTVVFPLLMDRNYGYFTAFDIVNVGGGTIAKANLVCTVTGVDISNTVVTKNFSPPADLTAGSSWNQLLLNQMGDRFVGAGTCTATGGSIIGTVNELKLGVATDTLLVYEGTNP
jgi:hypothetical protein